MEGLSVADALALQDNREDGFMGGNGMWVFFLFFLLAWGGNGGLFGGANGATNMINNDFLYTNLKSTLDQGFGQVANQSFGIQKDMLQGFNQVGNGLCNLGYQTQQGFSTLQSTIDNCCCQTNRNIDAVRYENAKNTCDIITSGNMNTRDLLEAGNANTQRIVDMFTQDKIETLRDQLQSANIALQNNAQTQTLINAIKPCPIPAYITCSPYAGGCGC